MDMKRTAFLLAAGACFLVFGPLAVKAAEDELRVPQVENARLRAIVATREKQLEDLKMELAALKKENERQTNALGNALNELKILKENLVAANARLPASGQAASPAVAPAAPVVPPKTDQGFITYEGQPRTKEWFEQMYVKYCNKFVLVEGKATIISDFESGEVGSYHASDGMWREQTPVGAVLRTPRGAKVLSVISDSEYLIIRPGYPAQTGRYGELLAGGQSEQLFHVKGMATGLVDGATFPDTRLVCVGTYRYGATSGAAKTVQSYIVYPPPPITRDQFADALKQGFKVDIIAPKAGQDLAPGTYLWTVVNLKDLKLGDRVRIVQGDTRFSGVVTKITRNILTLVNTRNDEKQSITIDKTAKISKQVPKDI
jgi:hypothetical protein